VRELKLKQASAVLAVAPKDLQNFVQAGVLRPRRQGNLRYFNRKQLLTAKVAFFLKDSLGASTRYLARFTRAVSTVPGFASGAADAVRLESGASGARRVSILIPIRALASELDHRLPLAESVKDLPRGRKRATWKAELREALLEGSRSLERVSATDIARTVADVRRRRRKAEPTVVAEAVEATA
jgi:hypothetical protein